MNYAICICTITQARRQTATRKLRACDVGDAGLPPNQHAGSNNEVGELFVCRYFLPPSFVAVVRNAHEEGRKMKWQQSFSLFFFLEFKALKSSIFSLNFHTQINAGFIKPGELLLRSRLSPMYAFASAYKIPLI